jgi:hypothetical protein
MMTKGVLSLLFVVVMLSSPNFCFSGEEPTVGGYPQHSPGALSNQQIGAGWGHQSMAYGVMNLMSGMTSQIARLVRSDHLTPEMRNRLADMLEHLASMMNEVPAYMMGTKNVGSGMIQEMQGMLKDIEQMREYIQSKERESAH